MQNTIREQKKLYLSYANSITADICKICDPLEKYLGISNFGYLQIFPDNRYFYICNNHTLVKEYISTIEDTNVFYGKQLFFPKSSSEFQYILWPRNPLNYSMNFYMKHHCWHGLSFIKNHNNYIELWWFATDPNNSYINDFYRSNINILEKFIHYFCTKTKNLIYHRKNKILSTFNRGIDLSSMRNVKDNIGEEKVKQFLEEIKLRSIEIKTYNGYATLSQREIQCLYFLSLGKTVKEIACKTGLSPRTVEHYLNNIKNKTGCHYKSDLINLYQEKLTKYF